MLDPIEIPLPVFFTAVEAESAEAAARLRDGGAPDAEALGRLLALRTRWHALRRDAESAADVDWVLALVQAAAGRVLASSEASAGVKAMASRAVAAWVPESPPAEPAAAAAAPPTVTPGARPAKVVKLTHLTNPSSGEQLTWDDSLF